LTIGGDGGTPAPSARCPAGQVARGTLIRAGAWIDALGTFCATPSLVYPVASPCRNGADCTSGICTSQGCATSACVPPPGCSCASYDGVDHLRCAGPQTQSEAEATCDGDCFPKPVPTPVVAARARELRDCQKARGRHADACGPRIP